MISLTVVQKNDCKCVVLSSKCSPPPLPRVEHKPLKGQEVLSVFWLRSLGNCEIIYYAGSSQYLQLGEDASNRCLSPDSGRQGAQLTLQRTEDPADRLGDKTEGTPRTGL